MTDNLKSPGDLTLIALFRSQGNHDVSEEAAAEFCTRYMEKLLSLVERNLASRFNPRIDPSDLVQSIFRSWFSGARQGRIHPSSKDEVWKLLSVVALNKVRNKVKFHDAKQREISRTVSEDGVFGSMPEPTAEDAVDFMDLVEVVGSRLDDMSRKTLEMILEGRSVEDIASNLGRTTKSVRRYKDRIGAVLQELVNDDLKTTNNRTDKDVDDPEAD